MSNVINEVQCKKCGEKKIKIKVGIYKHASKFVDETGHLWLGKLCPKCNVDRSRDNMQRLRSKDKNQDAQ